ncbi:Hypothetical protein NTJ_02489 [Nesidiocoris tenuis]|uniref:Uncharacterized protein n=1 Tax=Nesidiocoris tenuis TaxID=355587 RepID=A0ABN7ABK5_9HEMI|nr:Hypothetical protein NTJ_02489 [Nesidiocoris tenuis]
MDLSLTGRYHVVAVNGYSKIAWALVVIAQRCGGRGEGYRTVWPLAWPPRAPSAFELTPTGHECNTQGSRDLLLLRSFGSSAKFCLLLINPWSEEQGARGEAE